MGFVTDHNSFLPGQDVFLNFEFSVNFLYIHKSRSFKKPTFGASPFTITFWKAPGKSFLNRSMSGNVLQLRAWVDPVLDSQIVPADSFHHPNQTQASFFNGLPLALSSSLRADDRNCSICLTAYVNGEQPLRLPCSHVFGRDCLRTWLEEHNSCPLCRRELFPPLTDNSAREDPQSDSPAPSPINRTNPVPFSLELLRIVRGELRVRSREARQEADTARSLRNLDLYAELGLRRPETGAALLRLNEDYLQHLRTVIRTSALCHLHTEQELQLFTALESLHQFEGMGFALIREVRELTNIQLYAELAQEGVHWVRRTGWRTASGGRFLPVGWDPPRQDTQE